MAKEVGRQEGLGIGKETVRGTAVAPAYYIPWMELTIEDKIKTVVDDAALARLEGSDGEEVVQTFSEATWKTKVKDDHIGLVLLSLFGSVNSATASGETIVYDHTYSVGQSTQHQSVTLVNKGANTDKDYPNSVVGSVTFEAEALGWVTYEATAMGFASEAGSNTIAIADEADFNGRHLTFKNAATQSALDGAGTVAIRSFSLEISSNILTEDVLGNAEPEDILNQSFTISGSVVLTYNSETYRDLMTNGTYQALRFQMERPETIGVAEKPRLKIDLHRAFITNWERNLGLSDIVEETFDFNAHYSTADSAMVTAVLTNEIASY